MLVNGTAKTIISSKNFFQSSKTTGPRWYQFRCYTKNHSIPPLFFVDYHFWGPNEYKSPLNARKSREIKKSGWTSFWAWNFWTSTVRKSMKLWQCNIWGSNRRRTLSLVADNVWVSSTDRFKLNSSKNSKFWKPYYWDKNTLWIHQII